MGRIRTKHERQNALPKHLQEFAFADTCLDVAFGGHTIDNDSDMLKEYLTPIIDRFNKLSDEDKKLLHEYYLGDVVYSGLREREITKQFSKNKTYTINQIAAKLGINYVQAFRYIVPFLKSRGYIIGKETKSGKVENVTTNDLVW